MTAITTHVLDSVLGKPASGVHVTLEQKAGGTWKHVGASLTDADGRCRDLPPVAPGSAYRLTFATGEYLRRQGRTSLYPEITVTFQCGTDPHYHLPLLLSDNSYTTYRGS